MISPPAASTARIAARRRAPTPRRRVITTKIGAIPTGSMITDNVTAVSPSVDQFNAASLLRRRADDPVVAERADLRRRPRLELVGHDPLADLSHGRAHAVELLLRVLHRHLLAVQYVVV